MELSLMPQAEQESHNGGAANCSKPLYLKWNGHGVIVRQFTVKQCYSLHNTRHAMEDFKGLNKKKSLFTWAVGSQGSGLYFE